MASKLQVNYVPSQTIHPYLKHEKIWVIVHCIVWLFMTISSIPLLTHRQSMMKEYYSKAQCCECQYLITASVAFYWKWYPVAFDWTACQSMGYSFTRSDICNDTVCVPWDISYPYHRWMPNVFWGYLAVLVITAYIIKLIFQTFYSGKLMNGTTFAGNITATLLCYSPYLQCYQFKLWEVTPYDECNIASNNCYASVLQIGETIFLNCLIYCLALMLLYCTIENSWFNNYRRIICCGVIEWALVK